MNKLAELHLDAIEDSYHTVYVNMNEVEEVNNNLAASKSAKITEQIAIEFAQWMYDYKGDINKVEELFQEFLKTKQ